MSRKRPQEEYGESLAGRFKRLLDGEKDPFVGTLEMKPRPRCRSQRSRIVPPTMKRSEKRAGTIPGIKV